MPPRGRSIVTQETPSPPVGRPAGRPLYPTTFGPTDPPTFPGHARVDPIDPWVNSIDYHSDLQQAGVPAELHMFEKGRHGFGLRRTKLPITRWPELMEAWLHTIGVLAEDGSRAQGSD